MDNKSFQVNPWLHPRYSHAHPYLIFTYSSPHSYPYLVLIYIFDLIHILILSSFTSSLFTGSSLFNIYIYILVLIHILILSSFTFLSSFISLLCSHLHSCPHSYPYLVLIYILLIHILILSSFTLLSSFISLSCPHYILIPILSIHKITLNIIRLYNVYAVN